MNDALINYTKSKPVVTRARSMKTIVLYSPDMDFCVSFRMLLQDTYNIVTTTETEMLMILVKSMHPDLVIADTCMSERMNERFKRMKRENTKMKILCFYAPHHHTERFRETIPSIIDEALSKPLDLNEVTQRISDLVMDTT